jgi:DNA-binding transcriptional ArsR family regulator
VTFWSPNIVAVGPGSENTVFRALSDPHRRALLDALFADDGQRLGQLCELLPGITRFGVMKHLAVLEEANLVVTERRGRTKVHHLNPVPIQQIADRWIAKYAAGPVRELTALARRLEPPPTS